MAAHSATKNWARRVTLMLWDVAAWFLATLATLAARYEFNIQEEALQNNTWIYALIAAVLQLLIGFAVKLYRGRHQVGSFDEALSLSLIAVLSGVTAAIPFLIARFAPTDAFVIKPLSRGVPLGILMIVPPVAFLLMAAARFLSRALEARSVEQAARPNAEPVLIYGAGNAGQQLSRLISFDPDSPYYVVGFLDDDRDKGNLHLGRTRVLGGKQDLLEVARREGVSKVIMAIPTAPKSLLREVAELADRNDLELLVLPPVSEIVGGQVDVRTLHKIDVADLLGRSQVDTNLSEIASYLSGKVVLVSGAGGSIGSEIARQVHKFGPRELVLLDRDETLLHGVQLSIYGQALLDTPNIVLCDIRDEAALDRVFADHRPDVVFHAAALKHLPMLEHYPVEGWKTNVLGTLHMLQCARKYGVERFVNISTDKAADASSVLGKTKRWAEELTAWFAGEGCGTYLSVRFGNVLGSRGSMLHTFTGQIERGGPVTVTHPDITRYFMTIPEACQLTIQAGAIGQPGDVLVLDMGEPVKILDVANGLIRRSGKDVKIVFTGLRHGEKMHEVLFSSAESSTPTSHPLISRVAVPPLDPADLAAIDVGALGIPGDKPAKQREVVPR